MVSASPDAFSDPEPSTQAELVEPARELDAAGAAPIDVGGESRRTDRPSESRAALRSVAPPYAPVSRAKEKGRDRPGVRSLLVRDDQGRTHRADTRHSPGRRCG
jgi:dihydropteroate synthase